jgi:glucokinase
VSSPEATLDCIASAVRQTLSAGGLDSTQVKSVGLGIPGLVDAEKGIGLASVNLGWRDVAVRDGLQARLGLPCAIENDVRAAALGEARFGAGQGLDSLVFLTIGTGIAAAAILANQLYRGSHGLAGEIGHAVLQRDGAPCKCGGRGCFEALASGPAIAARLAQKMRLAGLSELPGDPARGLESLAARDVFRLAAHGDPLAQESICEAAEFIAQAIQFITLAYDPQVIVLGGGVVQAASQLIVPLRSALERLAKENWVFRTVYSPNLIQLSRLGEDIGILGAAALVVPMP